MTLLFMHGRRPPGQYRIVEKMPGVKQLEVLTVAGWRELYRPFIMRGLDPLRSGAALGRVIRALRDLGYIEATPDPADDDPRHDRAMEVSADV